MPYVLKLFRLIVSFCFKIVFVFFKALSIYLIVAFAALISTEGYSFVKQYVSANDEGKAYIICVFSMRTVEPSATDFSSCLPYKELSSLKARGEKPVEPIEGECPNGYQLKSGMMGMSCVASPSKRRN